MYFRKAMRLLCFNCCKDLFVTPTMTKYRRPSQMNNKLQNRKFKPESAKPNITILDAIEEISEGDLSVESNLKDYSSQFICHGE